MTEVGMAGAAMTKTLASGTMSWEAAVAGPLDAATCLWQDLDGLHVGPAPAASPPTSILWAWRDDGWLIRARLDGGTALIAVHHPGESANTGTTLPWAPGDGRVAASHGRGPASQDGGVGAVYQQIVVDGIDDGTGPVTFLRPAQS
jgi:hypothetical protein